MQACKIYAGAQNSCQNFVRDPYSFAREAIRALIFTSRRFKKARRSFQFLKIPFRKTYVYFLAG